MTSTAPGTGEARRRVALVQIAVGVPALVLSVFAVLLGFRFADKPLTGALPWAVLAPILLTFAVYFARATLVLRRCARGGTPGTESRERRREDGGA